MTKPELIALIGTMLSHLLQRDVDLPVSIIIRWLTNAIATGERIEIGGSGGISTIPRQARNGRYLKTSETVSAPSRHAVQFKTGLVLRDLITGQ